MAESMKSSSSTCGKDDESNERGDDRSRDNECSITNVLSTTGAAQTSFQEQVQETEIFRSVIPDTHISQLPPETLTAVFGYLNTLDLCRATRVCVAWRDVANHPTMWQDNVVSFNKLPKNPELLFPSLSRRGVKSLLISEVEVLFTGAQHIPYLSPGPFPDDYIETEQSLSGCLLRQLSNVTDLTLSDSYRINNGIIELITQHLKNLVRLNLRGCHYLTDVSLKHIAEGLPKLKWLNVEKCAFMSAVGVECLTIRHGPHPEKLPVLEFLGLRGRPTTTYSLLCLSQGQTSLVELDLSCQSLLTDAGMIHLAKMDKLSILNLESTNIGTAGMVHLAEGDSKITKLNLSNCSKLTNDGLEHVGRLTHLLDLNLSGCDIWDEGLELLVDFGSKIQILDLTVSRYVLDDAMKHVAKLKDIRELRLTLGDKGVGHLAAARSQVASLKGNGGMSDIGLRHMAKLTNLRQLSLYRSDISSKGLVNFMDGVAERMTSLKLVSHMSLNCRTLLYVAQRLFKLETLQLDNRHINDEGKAEAVRNLTRLRQFMVNGEKIIDEGKSAAAQNLPRSRQVQVLRNIIDEVRSFVYAERIISSDNVCSSNDVSSTNQGNERPIQVQKAEIFRPVLPNRDLGLLDVHVSQLPPKTLTTIFGYLDTLALCRATRVCAGWRDVANHPTLWQSNVVSLKKVPVNGHLLFPSLSRRGVKSIHISDVKVLYTGVQPIPESSERSEYRSHKYRSHSSKLKKSKFYTIAEHRLSGSPLTQLSNLTYLSVRTYDTYEAKLVTDDTIELITQFFNKLVRLDLHNCEELTDVSLWHIANRLPGLKRLDLDGCHKLSNRGVQYLSERDCRHSEQLPVLEFLGLKSYVSNHFSNQSLLYLSQGQANLVELDLSHRKELSNNGMIHLAKMNKLSILNLSYTRVGDAGLAHLAQGGSKVSKLYLRHCRKLTDNGLEHIGRLRQLLHLDLSGCEIGNLTLLAQFGSKIQILDFAEADDYFDDDMEHLAKLKDLKELRFFLGDDGFGHLAAAGSQVASLLGYDLVTDEGLQHLAKLTNLSQLYLFNSDITCEGLVDFLDGVAERLTHLDLDSCDNLDCRTLLHVAQRLVNLERLSLPRDYIDDDGMAAAARNLPRLRKFYVGCTNIIDEVRSIRHK